jgi:lipid-A-disaccharide synthase
MNRLGEGYRHVIPQATTVSRELLEQFSSRASFEIVDSSFDALLSARAALVKSGTSTLDATLLGVPFAVLYKTSTISYHIAKRLISVPYIAMTNVLAGRRIVREFVQDTVEPVALAEEMERLIAEGEYRRNVCEGLRDVREMLGPPGASERIARFIIEKYLQR